MANKTQAQAQSESRLPVRYMYWPAQSLRCSLFAVQYSTELLVDLAWVDDVRGDLDRTLHGDITVLNALGVLNGLMGAQLADEVTSISIPEFLSWMTDLPTDAPYWDMSKSPHVPALDPNGVWYRLFDVESDPTEEPLQEDLMRRFRSLFAAPEDLQGLTVEVCTAFWERYLSKEFLRLEPILRRAAALGAQDPSPKSHHEFTMEVIGRTPIGPAPPDFHSGDILAAPVCHLGAFPIVAHYDNPRWSTVYAFEAARMPAIASLHVGAKASTYRALADDNRLEIIRLLAEGEMYGLELSKRIGISQPAVSKHLSILASEGILKMYRDGLMKYFFIDPARLDQISESIKDLKGTESSG